MPRTYQELREYVWDERLLVPYVFLVAVYMYTDLPPEEPYTAVVKAAPILYLVCYVGQCTTPRYSKNMLAQAARAGLVMSSLGDTCLVWRYQLFLPGMFFFALTLVAYIRGLRLWMYEWRYPVTNMYQIELFILWSVSYIFLFHGIDSWFMALCVFCYSFLLYTMAYLALQRHCFEDNRGSLYGAVGACVFLVSDLLIAVCKWMFDFPYSEGLIMVTYYTAQGCIAAGTVHSARANRRELRARGLL